jgi:RNA polymerase primary sigma factor
MRHPSVDLYQQDIRSIALLSDAEEAALGQIISAGRAAAEKLPHVASDAERADLEAAIAAAAEARTQLVTANVRWVLTLAYRHYGWSVDLPDRIQDGNLGLLRAAESFDCTQGKFVIYAKYWIWQMMERGYLADRPIRRPVDHTIERRRIGRTAARLQQTLGREPSLGELAQATGLTPHQIARAQADVVVVGLSEPLGTDEDAKTIGEVLPDEQSIAPEGYVLEADERRELRWAVGQLPPCEGAYLTLRYGLDDGVERTHEQVCAELGMSEPGRQVEVRALRGLRQIYRAIMAGCSVLERRR